MELWYALQVSARQEITVALALRELNIAEFMPAHVSNKAGTSPVDINKPLFPGYVFCRLDLQLGPKLYTIPGVRRIVGYGPKPIAIPDIEIEAVRVLTATRLPLQTSTALVPGEQVVVTDGPFRGLKGIVISTNKARQFVIQLPLLNRSVGVELPSECVTKYSCT